MRIGLAEEAAVPLMNRVDPFGQIHAVQARGTLTGNRGVIHDPATRTLLKRRWTTKAWLICRCDFGTRRRDVMGRNAPSGGAGWTELFFLDEVTALAAGHRPCFYCRRESAVAFADCFGRDFGIARPKASDMDAVLHGQRLASGGRPLPATKLETLPDGVVVADGTTALAIAAGRARRWSFSGYGPPLRLDRLDRSSLTVVTPAATVAALAAGYRPAWHA